MGKDIERIYKHSHSKLSTLSLKAPVISSSYSQTSPDTELSTMSVPSVRDKNKNNSVLCYQNTIQNDVSIKNNDDIQSCDTPIKKMYIITTTSTPNNHEQRIATTFTSILNL